MAEQRVESIDVFRGVAILMVVLFHYTARLPAEVLHVTGPAAPQFAYGWDAVYFFYLISGYCIFLTLERSATVPLFLARRISRIYPAFVAALLILFALQFAIELPSSEVAHYREHAPGMIDLVLNFFLIGEIGEWVNGSFWSIAVEVKFYVLVALMALLIKDRAVLPHHAPDPRPVLPFSPRFSSGGSANRWKPWRCTCSTGEKVPNRRKLPDHRRLSVNRPESPWRKTGALGQIGAQTCFVDCFAA